ncbi:hypothetical protein K438DRAFT_1982550 [Mycena galopus ATCC 62051]|nr:hypothetical protein K438DRAFT_1982550 [Mycena galopus ATCC 62051]
MSLRAVALQTATNTAKDAGEREMKNLKETSARECADLRAQLESLKTERSAFERELSAFERELSAFERELSAFERELSAFERELSAFERELSAFERERDRIQNAILEHRRSLTQNLDQMIDSLRPNPFLNPPQSSATVVPGTSLKSRISDSVPLRRADSHPVLAKRARSPPCTEQPEVSATKRPRRSISPGPLLPRIDAYHDGYITADHRTPLPFRRAPIVARVSS